MKNFYALLLFFFFGFAVSAQNSPPSVQFQSGAEVFPSNFIPASRIVPSVEPGEIAGGHFVRYIQCKTLPSGPERAGLEAKGARFLGYVPFGAYLVAFPERFDLVELEAIGVRSIVPVKNAWKMSASLRDSSLGAWAIHGNQVDINIQVYPHISIGQGAELCRRQGMTVLLEGNQNGFLTVRLPQSGLHQAAALPWVRYMELVPPPAEPDDIHGRSLHRSGALDSDHALGKKFNGEGVAVLVRDDGPIGPHIDFQGRLYDRTESSDNGTHGDGVGGILAGAGNLDPTKKGMAAGATVYTLNYTPEFQDETLPLHLEKNVTITNTSYSNGCNAGYTLAAQTVDAQMFDHPTLMHVFSAGNSNNIATCQSYGAGNQWGNITGGHKMAKNAIATANLMQDATLVTSSSRGPAYDGRLKPDIAAYGSFQMSTDHDNQYLVFSGTSAAAPGIAGCLAQLTQAYKTQFGSAQPPAALLKAALLNTANDLGNTGPDFKFGWGHVNAWRAWRLLEAKRWAEGSADQAATNTHILTIPPNIREARIMLYWADPPAELQAAKALLNDLDLRLTGPDGTVHHPWKLDPTPDPAILDSPAGRGRDSLNNTEQVAVSAPVAGAWEIRVDGTEVPFGPQDYYLAWEFLTDDIRIAYPAGGESLVPGETERIYWDAEGNEGTFSLRYSTDDGFSWIQIADVAGHQRMYDWTIPDELSGKVRLLIQRGTTTYTTPLPCTIAPLPENIQVEQVCPNHMTISWKPAHDTLPGEVFLLGKKYMELVGTTPGNTFTIPLQNGGAPQWVSVRASDGKGLVGRRALAVQWPGELRNCPQTDNLGVRALVSPANKAVVRCENFSLPVTVRLQNEGSNSVSGAVLHYAVDGGAVVSQTAPNLSPGASVDFTFQTPIAINDNRFIDLMVWSSYAPEDAFFNDTLRRSIMVVSQPRQVYFTENFQGLVFPPFGWNITNPDDGITWSRTPGSVTGANGQPTRAAVLNCYFYTTPGQSDYIDMIPVDLSQLNNPALTFQFAHARGGSSDFEQMRVEVFPACDLDAPPVVIWEKIDPELATTTANGAFAPNEASDWQKEMISLQPFKDQELIIRFAAVSNTGNNIYLDNIGITQYTITPPMASLVAATDSACILDTVLFTAAPTGGSYTNYSWDFGPSSLPNIAAGPGPHPVRFLTAGVKTVRLRVWNGAGADTLLHPLQVTGNPLVGFSAQLNGQMVQFTNSSQNAISYLWDFGDPASGPDNTSTDPNPTHIFSAPGTYSVKLVAANQCRTASKSLSVSITTSLHTPSGQPDIRILPNPATGDFRVIFDSGTAGGEARLNLFDIQGRVVKTVETPLLQGITMVPFEGLYLPKGVYHLRVSTEAGMQVRLVAIQ